MDTQEQEFSLPISTRALRPAGVQSALTCSTCNEPRARWTRSRFPGASQPTDPALCSLCFFRVSGWSAVAANRARLRLVAGAISVRSGKKVELQDGLPTLIADADNILGAITLQDRVEAIRSHA